MEHSWEYELLEIGVGVKAKIFVKVSNQNGSPISQEGMMIMAYNGMDKKIHTLFWGDGPFSIAPSFELIDEKNFKAMAKNTEGQMGGGYSTIKENSMTDKGFYLDSDGNEVADGITVMRKKE